MNSLWSGSERVRIGERLKATLAGIMELDLLRGRQLQLVDAVLDGEPAASVAPRDADLQSAAEDGAPTARRQQVSGDVGNMITIGGRDVQLQFLLTPQDISENTKTQVLCHFGTNGVKPVQNTAHS